jgi:4-hydroxyphenylacetate 3-monooxygenase/4-hydroxybutyryl-CoA dehydratase/vinylacetyl-CoA-Delta-isomerase
MQAEEFYAEEIGELANKYLKRNPRIHSEKIHRCYRGLENMLVSDLACVMQVAGLHGGGSPQMETITMMGRYDLDSLKSIAKYLFGIEGSLAMYDRKTVTPRKMLERFRSLLRGN